jgi:transcription-repair coupling factor (superfamily II helicase)
VRSFLGTPGSKRVVTARPEIVLPFLAGITAEQGEGTLWILQPSADGARSLSRTLKEAHIKPGPVSTQAPPICWLPPLFARCYDSFGTDLEVMWNHMATVYRLETQDKPRVVVTSPDALCSTTLTKDTMRRFSQVVIAGEKLKREAFIQRLIAAGYARGDLAIEPGQMAVRGGVIDVFPPHLPYPVRIDFFGDEVDRISSFYPESQRSLGRIEMVELPPVSAFLCAPEQITAMEERIRSLAEVCEIPSIRLATILDDLRSGFIPPGALAYLPAVVDELRPVHGLISADSRVLHPGSEGLQASLEEYSNYLSTSAQDAIQQHQLASGPEAFCSVGEIQEVLQRFADRSEITALSMSDEQAEAITERAVAAEPVVELKTLLQRKEDPEHPFRPVAQTLGGWVKGGLSVHLLARGESQRRRIRSLLESYDHPPIRGEGWLFDQHPPGLYLWSGSLKGSFKSQDMGVAYIDETEIFGQKPRQAKRMSPPADALMQAFKAMSPGDLVVHRDHGIGRYLNLKRMRAGGIETDFLQLEYADRAKLFLPVTRIELLERYVSSGREGFTPPLHKLGGTRWKTSRKRAKQAAEKIASELLQLYAERNAAKGHPFSEPDELFAQFEAGFPFQETPDQERAIKEVLQDMVKERPMDRIVAGDVGYGKTEVAMRAAFKAMEDGKQVAIMVPTTILAEQHYLTMTERFRAFGIRVAQLSRFVTPAEQKKTLAGLSDGSVDLVVGTHRILQSDLRFKELGLLVIDEEHRFGVKHKEKLRRFRAHIDVLSLSATPIPRTLNMALLGIRDLSTITTAPAGRQSVQTSVARFDSPMLHKGIARELDRGGQVYYVTHRIQGMARLHDELAELLPDARMEIAHGQMPPRKLEKIMRSFIRGEIDVLITTTIIESGIDVPNANTMFIHHAEFFGLAQLHQLRGRIGRSARKAYCTFLVPHPKTLTEEARRRIGVLQRMNTLGTGFSLAVEDMELRGAGNILGSEQHGNMDAIGYNGFMDLLQETIHELKGEAPEMARDAEVQIDVSAFIPDDYLPDPHERLTLYRRFAATRETQELRELTNETQDRYGRIPTPFQTLVQLNELRIRALRLGLSQLVVSKAKVRMGFGDLDPTRALPGLSIRPEVLTAFVTRPQSRYKLTPDIALERKVVGTEKEDLLATADAVLRELARFIRKKDTN